MTSLPFRLAALAVLALLPTWVTAQPTEPTGVAVYRYVAAGRPAAAVDLWGVRQPGRYLVEPGLSLLDALALAGGPALAADDLTARTATVTITRAEGAGRVVAARLTLDELAEGGAAVPALVEGDLVVVRTTGAGRIAVPVDVWGAVGQPGRYEVVPGADLLDVLTLAGGPRLVTEDNRVSQTARLTLSRVVSGGREVVFEGAVEALAEGATPAVEAGDLVTVRLAQRQRFGWRDAISVATASASLVLLVLRINDLAQ